jgi:RNA polymerase sigma factor (sigma-70 family)
MSRDGLAPKPSVDSTLALAYPRAVPARAPGGTLRALLHRVGVITAPPPASAARAEAEEALPTFGPLTPPAPQAALRPEPSEHPVRSGGGQAPSERPSPTSPAPASVDRLAAVAEPWEVDELVRRSQRGDRAAFSELFRRHRGDVSRLVFRMLGPTADVEDVVQEVFLQVHKSLGEFRGQAKFTTWLHRVTVNVVLMVRRAARSRPVFAGEPVSDHEPDRGIQPDEDASRRARIEAFRRLLDRLPEKKRTVFVLHELEGKAPVEIAEIVDAPVLTVRTRLFYARRELAEMMREEPTLAQLAAELACDDRRAGAEGPAARGHERAEEEAT